MYQLIIQTEEGKSTSAPKESCELFPLLEFNACGASYHSLMEYNKTHC